MQSLVRCLPEAQAYNNPFSLMSRFEALLAKPKWSKHFKDAIEWNLWALLLREATISCGTPTKWHRIDVARHSLQCCNNRVCNGCRRCFGLGRRRWLRDRRTLRHRSYRKPVCFWRHHRLLIRQLCVKSRDLDTCHHCVVCLSQNGKVVKTQSNPIAQLCNSEIPPVFQPFKVKNSSPKRSKKKNMVLPTTIAENIPHTIFGEKLLLVAFGGFINPGDIFKPHSSTPVPHTCASIACCLGSEQTAMQRLFLGIPVGDEERWIFRIEWCPPVWGPGDPNISWWTSGFESRQFLG